MSGRPHESARGRPGASSRSCARTSRPARSRAAAYELGISETTARQHLSGLYRRTGLPERGAGRVPTRAWRDRWGRPTSRMVSSLRLVLHGLTMLEQEADGASSDAPWTANQARCRIQLPRRVIPIGRSCRRHTPPSTISRWRGRRTRGRSEGRSWQRHVRERRPSCGSSRPWITATRRRSRRS